MDYSEEDLPDYIKKEIIRKEIETLLGVDEPSEDEYYEYKEFDPYSLDATVHPHLESKFRHGIKELPPAYKNLKPAAKSVLECEYIRITKDRFYTSTDLSDVSTYVKISIQGQRGNFYLPTSKLSELLKRKFYEYSIPDRIGTLSLILKFNVDQKFIKENVRTR